MPPEMDEIDDILSMDEGLDAEEDVGATEIALDGLVGSMFDAIASEDREGFKRALRDAFEMLAAETPTQEFADLGV